MKTPSIPWEIDCRCVKQKQDADEDFLFVDCREKSEWDMVSIHGATLVPMSEITTRLADLGPNKERPIVVHCHHGGRSLKVAQWLRQQGYQNAQSMAGGIDQWAVDIDPALARY